MPEVQENENIDHERNDSEIYNRMISSMENNNNMKKVLNFENSEFEHLSDDDNNRLNVIELSEELVANSKSKEYSRDEMWQCFFVWNCI